MPDLTLAQAWDAVYTAVRSLGFDSVNALEDAIVAGDPIRYMPEVRRVNAYLLAIDPALVLKGLDS